jgi:hypothetical protein
MRKGRFSEEQMVAIIREADRDPVAAVAKRYGISEQTIYTNTPTIAMAPIQRKVTSWKCRQSRPAGCSMV